MDDISPLDPTQHVGWCVVAHPGRVGDTLHRRSESEWRALGTLWGMDDISPLGPTLHVGWCAVAHPRRVGDTLHLRSESEVACPRHAMWMMS